MVSFTLGSSKVQKSELIKVIKKSSWKFIVKQFIKIYSTALALLRSELLKIFLEMHVICKSTHTQRCVGFCVH